MAVTAYWLGTAQAIAQVIRFTPGGTIGTETFTITRNNKTIAYTAVGGDTATSVCTGLAAAFALCTAPEFTTENTITNNGATIDFTMTTTGVPATFTSGATGSATLVTSTVTAASGPNFWNVATNWLNSAATNLVPVSTDTVYVDGLVPIRYGLAQSAVTLAAMYVKGSVEIGLPPTNANGYAEDRAQYLAIGVTACEVDSSAGMIAINAGSVLTTMNVYNTGTPTQTQTHALRFLGTNASNVLNIFSGSVGIAERPTEVSTLLTCRIGTLQGGSPDVYVGTGSTLGTFTIASGTLTSHSNITTVTCQGGTLITRETATLTTVTVRKSGVLQHDSSGTITTLNAGPDGEIDFTRDLRARTVTNANVYANTKISDNYKTVTWTNGLILVQCGLVDVTLDVGTGITLTVA